MKDRILRQELLKLQSKAYELTDNIADLIESLGMGLSQKGTETNKEDKE